MPSKPGATSTPRHTLLDLLHKGIYPAIAIALIGAGLYLNHAQRKTEQEVERLRDDLRQKDENAKRAQGETREQGERADKAESGAQRLRVELCAVTYQAIWDVSDTAAKTRVASRHAAIEDRDTKQIGARARDL